MSEGSGVGDDADATGSNGSNGRAAHRSRPAGGAGADDDSAASAPWERPRTWASTPRLESTRVDDLLARLGEPDDPQDGRRSRRRSETGSRVPASELLAAFEPAASENEPVEAGPDDAAPAVADAASGSPTDPVSDHAASDGPADRPDAVTPAGDDPAPSVAATGSMAAILDSAGSAPMDLLTHRSGPPGADPGPGGVTGDAGTSAPTDVLPPYAPIGPGAAGVGAEATAAPPGSLPGDPAPGTPFRSDRTEVDPALGHPVSGGSVAGDSVAGDSATGGSVAGDSVANDSAAAIGPAVGPAAAVGVPAGRVRAPRRFPNRPHGGWLYAGRGIAAVLAVVVLAAVGINWRILDRANVGLAAGAVAAINTADPNIIRTEPPTAPDSAAPTTGASSDGGIVPVAAPTKTYAAENILLLGSDTRANGNGNAGNSDGNEGSAQSDTLMIAHLSADRQHVTIVSIPRDTKVDAPSCRDWDQVTGKLLDKTEGGPGNRWKITNAYAVGGPICTVAAVQKLTGLQIDRMLGIDFNGFKAMVDALGGITVDICKPIVDAELQTVAPSAGVQVIHGEEALSLVRARKVIGDQQSDLARIHRQQVVLSAILRQVASAGTLLNPAKLDNFLQAFTKNTFNANIKLNDLVTLADSLGDLNPDRVTFYTVPTAPDPTDSDSLVLDQTKAPAVFAALRTDAPLPGQVPVTPTPTPSPATTPAASSASASPSSAPARPSASLPAPSSAPPSAVRPTTVSVDPADVALDVVNLSGRPGVGGQVQEALQASGFVIPDNQVSRPDTAVAAVTVQYSGSNRNAALAVAAAVPGAAVVAVSGLGARVRLMLGKSYAGSILPVRLGQPLPASLVPAPSVLPVIGTTTTSPAASSVFDAFGSLGSASPVPGVSGSGGGSTGGGPAATLKAGDLSAVNAGSRSCA